MIILIIIAVFMITQLVVVGYLTGWGPLKFLNDFRMAKIPGNAENYNMDTVEPMENSPLQGRNVCFLGSSVTYGSASLQQGIPEYFAARMGCSYTKEAVSGTTLVDNGNSSYVQRLINNVDPRTQYDLLICQVSTNDATKELPLGDISDSRNLEDFDTSTITGAMEYIICYAQETWGCQVVFYTGSYYDSEAYHAMVVRLIELQEKWGIGVLDLWNDSAFNAISDENRDLYMNDKIHPTKAGYKEWWCPEMEQQLIEYLSSQSFATENPWG